MTEQLTAYIDGNRVGVFTRTSGDITFTFDDGWRNTARRLELSLSLPKSRRTHTGPAPENYLWNLLPDNVAVLERWGTQFGVSPRNPMALLRHIGLDTAGAVQLAEEDHPSLTGPSSLEPIDEPEIAAHVRQLRVDPEAWLLPGHNSGYFSLAGAQSKFALARSLDGSWMVPIGRAPSTHILKPGIAGLRRGDLNEHLSLAAAAKLGLRTAESSIAAFEDETVIVVERYDRVTDTQSNVTRLHQEDTAQAAGIHPAGKYQNEGGPAIHTLVGIIRGARGRDRESANRLFEATLFNWAALATDAHAKNYSLIHDRDNGPSLAPLYDIATALPYPDIDTRKAKMTMAYGGHYRAGEIEPRHILADAAEAGIDPDWVMDRATEIVSGLPGAYAEAAADASLTGDAAVFADEIIDAAKIRSDRLSRELERTPAPTATPVRHRRPAPTPSAATQPRRGDVGLPGNAGAFASKRHSLPDTSLN